MARTRVLSGIGRTALALAVAGVLFLVGRSNAHDLGRVHLRLEAGWLLASIPLYAIASLCLAVGWDAELAAFGHRLRLVTAVRVWWRAQLARYVPTGLAAFASRAALARNEGVPASLGAASLAVELACLIGWGSLIAAVGVPSSLLSTPGRLVLGIGAAGGLASLPVLYPRLAGLTKRFSTLANLECDRPRLYLAEGWYGVSVAVKSVAFVVFAAALTSVHLGDAWLLSGGVQGAAVVGIIGITPAGLGVRETAMVGLLSHRLGTADAAALAVAWRAYEFAFELAWLGLGTVWKEKAPVA